MLDRFSYVVLWVSCTGLPWLVPSTGGEGLYLSVRQDYLPPTSWAIDKIKNYRQGRLSLQLLLFSSFSAVPTVVLFEAAVYHGIEGRQQPMAPRSAASKGQWEGDILSGCRRRGRRGSSPGGRG